MSEIFKEKDKVNRKWKEDLLGIGVEFQIEQKFADEGDEIGHYTFINGLELDFIYGGEKETVKEIFIGYFDSCGVDNGTYAANETEEEKVIEWYKKGEFYE